MSLREIKGRDIADKQGIARHKGLWVVPSQSGKGRYQVDAEKQTCSCPDFDIRRQKCKHIFAVEVTIQRTHTAVTQNGQTTVTETVKVTRKETYRQQWPAYNKAQTMEKAQFHICFTNSVRESAAPRNMAEARDVCRSKI